MNDIPRHTKIAIYDEDPDGTIRYSVDSYFEELASRKQGVIAQIKTSKNNFLSDLITSVEPVNKQLTKELKLTIILDEWNQPARIIKEYITRRDDFKRR